jgi:cytochrome c oxidase assembly protein subunit 19
MSGMSMGRPKQVVNPPQRGIFPLDHERECKAPMEQYTACLARERDTHYKCKDYSRLYLQCRMDHDLMAKENLDDLGFSNERRVMGAKEYDMKKEKQGFVAGKHISTDNSKWWFQKTFKSWSSSSSDS